MSGHGSPADEPVDCSDLRVAVVASSWHDEVMDGLIAGAREALKAYHVGDVEEVRVPGSFELPVVAAALARNGHDAVVALGVVIRGGTPHFDYVAGECAKGIGNVAFNAQAAVTFGVLTCDTVEQAIDRAGVKAGNKGSEAAAACIEMVNLHAKLATTLATDGKKS